LPIFIVAIGTAGIVNSYIGIRYAFKSTVFPVIFMGQLAHGPDTHFNFGQAGFLNYIGVLGKA
jgi:hypothetical protein